VPKLPKTGPETLKRYDALAEDLVARGAKKSQMFGMPVLKKGDKVFCGTFGDAMTFKLGSPEEAAAAMKRKGVEAFEPMPGRAMKAWILVPLEHSRAWKKLAEQAFEQLR
jgi:hypothetical protein